MLRNHCLPAVLSVCILAGSALPGSSFGQVPAPELQPRHTDAYAPVVNTGDSNVTSEYIAFERPLPVGGAISRDSRAALSGTHSEAESRLRSDSKVFLTFNQSSGVVGQPFEMNLKLDNTNTTSGGPFDIFNVHLSVTLPASWTVNSFRKNTGFSFFESCSTTGNVFSCDALSFGANQTETVVVVVTGSETGTFELPLTSTQTNFDPDTSNNTDTELFVIGGSGSISGTVFDDFNGNQLLENGENRLLGFTVFLDRNFNGILDAGDTATTSVANGAYSFTALEDGSYTVRIVLPTQRTLSVPASGSYSVTITNGSDEVGIDFGSFIPGVISGMKQNDLLSDGVLDSGDPGLDSWTIHLTGAQTANTLTNASGNYSFVDLTPGQYVVAEEGQTGWTQIVPAGGENYTYTVVSGSSFDDANFGNWKEPGPLLVVKFNDEDRNGQNNDENLLDGWIIFIDENGNNTFDTGEIGSTTGSSGAGSAILQSPTPGIKSVCELAQDEWISTAPGGSTCQSVTLESDVTHASISFGNAKLGSIAGIAFDDLNGDGNRGPSDAPLSNIIVGLDLDNDGAIGTGEPETRTLADGSYRFGSLLDKTYIVRAILPGNRLLTLPASGFYSVTIFHGNDVGDVNFGSYALGKISGIKWLDSDGDGVRETSNGESDLGGWTIVLKDSEGLVLQQKVTNSQGGYTFSGLAPNMYTVGEILKTNWVQSFPFKSTGDTEHSVLVESDDDITDILFGNRPASTDIRVIKTASPSLVSKDDTVHFQIVVTNIGADDAENVTLNDQLLFGFPFLAMTTSRQACTRTGQTIGCQFGTLAPGDSVTVRVDVRASSLGNQNNLASATTTSPDANDLNNTSVASVIVVPVILNITAIGAMDMCFSDVNPLTDGTTDGNRVTLTIAVTNGGTLKSETAGLRLTDAETGRVLPDGSGSISPIVVPPEQTVTSPYLWNTTGFAWKDNETQHPLPRIIKVELLYKGEVIQTEQREILVRPKPIVLVHGLWANPAGWSAYPGFAKAKHANWDASRVVAVTGMDTGIFPLAAFDRPSLAPRIFSKETIQDNAAKLKATIDQVRETTKSCHLDIVAHSMGGLISRDYIHRVMPENVGDGEPLVRHLVQLGTPNEGSPCADDIMATYGSMVKDPRYKAALARRSPPNNIIELSTTHLKTTFNKQIKNQKRVRFYILYGDVVPFTCRLFEFGDGVVTVESALASTGGVPTFVGSTHRSLVHVQMSGSQEAFNSFVKPILSDPPAGSIPFTEEDEGLPEGDPTRAFVSGSGSEAEYVISASGTVLRGVPEDIPIRVPAASAFGLTYLTSLETTSTLIDPSGVPVDTVLAGSADASGLVRAQQVASPQAGTWTLRLEQSSADTVAVLVSGWVKGSSVSLGVATSPPDPEQKVSILATFTDAGAPITGASVSAAIAGTSTDESVVLTDDGLQRDATAGDGVYTGSFRPPESGRYLISVDASSGNDSRVKAISVDLSSISGVAIEPKSDEVPDQISLLPAYPNPSRRLVYIPFDVSRSSRVDVRVYNLLGKEVALVVDRRVSPGRYETALSTADLSPGLYIIRARIDGRVFSRSFTVLR